MKCYPGDIILVRNLVFGTGTKDHALKGRPCIVLYSELDRNKNENIWCLYLTTQYQHLYSPRGKNYLPFQYNKEDVLIQLEDMRKISIDQVEGPCSSVGRDYFDILYYYFNLDSCTSLPEKRELIYNIYNMLYEMPDLEKFLAYRKREFINSKRSNKEEPSNREVILKKSNNKRVRGSMAYKKEREQLLLKDKYSYER